MSLVVPAIEGGETKFKHTSNVWVLAAGWTKQIRSLLGAFES